MYVSYALCSFSLNGGTALTLYHLSFPSSQFIRFGGGNNKKNNGKLPLKNVGNVVIFPYLDDLVLPNANFALKYTYTNKMVRFEWQTVPFGVNSASAYVHFELEYLVDTPNLVYVRYSHDSNPAFFNGESAAIGIQAGELVFEILQMTLP